MASHPVPGGKFLSQGLVILYEDRDLLVVDKPPGLLTIATETENRRTAYFILTDYVRKGASKSRNRVFIVHRLDREASGVLVFAKNEPAKLRLQKDWEQTKKLYLAVVHGQCKKTEDVISSCLAENRAHVVYATSDPAKGKLSRTAYRVLAEGNGRTLLEVDLLTGRKHQIRVHLAGMGNPIVGDAKYGKPERAPARLALHARSLSFNHPHNGRRLTFESRIPAYLKALVGGKAVFARPLPKPRQPT
ncbi:MAG: RluA family pseudouridine synthase [Planctomycetota bacterium]